tara:strand:+ start:10408 stop:10590 length:183 start_codon:yes stop_codon:yes gene_type:complete
MPLLPNISPELIDFLIKKEKKEQLERPFLQIPAPNIAILPPKKAENYPENEENGVIIIDI